MIADNKKATLIIELNASKTDERVRNLLSLIDILVTETRLENDTAEGNELYRNQGKIQGLVDLQESIIRGLPATQKN
jgi:hypothetical protein